MLSKIEKFNKIAGKLEADELLHNKELMWKELQNSAKRVLEEAQELYEATLYKDIEEVLDGVVDVKYTVGHTQILLEMMKVDVVGACDEICENNLSKFTTNKELAEKTVEKMVKEGVECVAEPKQEYGELYYAIKRVEDSKVMKPIGYCSPNISEYIPKNALSYLGGTKDAA